MPAFHGVLDLVSWIASDLIADRLVRGPGGPRQLEVTGCRRSIGEGERIVIAISHRSDVPAHVVEVTVTDRDGTASEWHQDRVPAYSPLEIELPAGAHPALVRVTWSRWTEERRRASGGQRHLELEVVDRPL